MQTFSYRRGYNARQAAISGLASVVMLVWAIVDHKYLLGFVGIAGLAVAGAAAMRVMASGPALIIRESSVAVGGPFGTRELSWADVDDVVLINRGASMILGIFIGGTLALCFQTKDSLVNRNRIMLPVAAIDLPAGGAPKLLEELNSSLVRYREGAGVDAPSAASETAAVMNIIRADRSSSL